MSRAKTGLVRFAAMRETASGMVVKVIRVPTPEDQPIEDSS
jgi:hypothetical protein